MSELINSILQNADYFVFLFFRVGALIISSPIFGRVNIPQMTKIVFAASLTFLFFIAYPPAAAIEYGTLLGFAGIAISEILIGVALAYVTNVFFTFTYIGGQLMDMQIGFGIVNVYDPQNQTQVPMLGNVLNLILLIIFFSVDGHHRFIEIIKITLDKIPVGSSVFRPEIGMVALEVFAKSFMLGIMVALPIIGSGIILEFTLGMLMRTVPQIHMFVVGIPLKLLVGLFIFATVIPVYANFSDRIFNEMFAGIDRMLTTFMPG